MAAYPKAVLGDWAARWSHPRRRHSSSTPKGSQEHSNKVPASKQIPASAPVGAPASEGKGVKRKKHMAEEVIVPATPATSSVPTKKSGHITKQQQLAADLRQAGGLKTTKRPQKKRKIVTKKRHKSQEPKDSINLADSPGESESSESPTAEDMAFVVDDDSPAEEEESPSASEEFEDKDDDDDRNDY